MVQKVKQKTRKVTKVEVRRIPVKVVDAIHKELATLRVVSLTLDYAAGHAAQKSCDFTEKSLSDLSLAMDGCIEQISSIMEQAQNGKQK